MKKTIHCIWLGGEKTPLAKRCRESWEKFAPGWEIKEWNVLPEDVPEFVAEAVRSRKWAFASDWFRFWILHGEGGVYLDYDEELIAPVDGAWPSCEWVAAEWVRRVEWGYGPGCGIALEKGSSLAKRMLGYYDAARFGTEKTVGDIMEEFIGTPRDTTAIRVLPPQMMSAVDWKGRSRRDGTTVGFHHYALSWISPRRRICRWLAWHHCDWVVQLGLKARAFLVARSRMQTGND